MYPVRGLKSFGLNQRKSSTSAELVRRASDIVQASTSSSQAFQKPIYEPLDSDLLRSRRFSSFSSGSSSGKNSPSIMVRKEIKRGNMTKSFEHTSSGGKK